MNYSDQFIEGLRFLGKVNKADKKIATKLAGYKAVIEQNQAPEHRDQYAQITEVIHRLAEAYVTQYPGRLAHSCHSVSHGFLHSWNRSRFGPAFPLTVTIGNVIYQGESVYNVSKAYLKKILNEGKSGTEKLNVHVWLTLDNMTVIDLTILSSLAAMELREPTREDESSVLVWREDAPGEFRYEPLLVHNGFFDIVDQGDGNSRFQMPVGR